MIFVGSLTYAKKLISINDAIKKYEGVWVNEEYTGEKVTRPQKFVITADGGVEDWALATQASPTFRGNYKMVESWIDRKGCTYCTVNLRYAAGALSQELWKLNKTGDILEINFTLTSGYEYPKKINPEPDPGSVPTLYYLMYYRQ